MEGSGGMADFAVAVTNVIHRCLAVSGGEEVLVVADPGSTLIADALRREAAAAGADAVLALMDKRATHGTEPPASIAAALSACDVFLAPTTRSLSHTSARKDATNVGARGATMPGVTADMLARVMAVDFEKMARRSLSFCQRLRRRSSLARAARRSHSIWPDGPGSQTTAI